MLFRIYIGLALFAALPAWSQVEPSATGPSSSAATEMQTPPPVSGEAYPTATGSEGRSNYLSAGLSVNTAYDDNVLPSGGSKPTGDSTYMIDPTFMMDQTSPRSHRTFTYSAGFTLYEHNSELNSLNQNVSAFYLYRLSPHITFDVRDSFVQSSNVFDQPYGGVPGSTQAPTESVVAPFAEERSNVATGSLSYQVSRNVMIGGSGTSSVMTYPNSAQASGIANSNSLAGSAFYSRRLSNTQYMGVSYQYSSMKAATPMSESDTQIHTISSYYTVYLKHALSISVSGGPQNFTVTESPLPASGSWTPALTASMGWQTGRVNIAASYSREISGAGGLLGAFKSNFTSVSARWQMARNWTLGSAANYGSNTSATPLSFSSNQGGHSVSLTASVQHPIGERIAAEAGYNRLSQSYGGVAVISANPDSDRVYVSISYQLRRPLGR
jgi:hypothetical protein